jgi:DNA repair ATPase RecN
MQMEKMKEVVEQYGRIINELQAKNQVLEDEAQQLRTLSQHKDRCLVENYGLSQKYAKVCDELERERRLREGYEITIDSLRK